MCRTGFKSSEVLKEKEKKDEEYDDDDDEGIKEVNGDENEDKKEKKIEDECIVIWVDEGEGSHDRNESTVHPLGQEGEGQRGRQMRYGSFVILARGSGGHISDKEEERKCCQSADSLFFDVFYTRNGIKSKKKK